MFEVSSGRLGFDPSADRAFAIIRDWAGAVSFENIKWKTLLCYDNMGALIPSLTDNSRKVAAALFAHPDDAEILCGGVLLRLRDNGWAIHIITSCAGDCGTMTMTADEIVRVRRAEAAAASRLLGGQHHGMEELDGRICYSRVTVQKAIDLFRAINPTLVFTHPRKDYMLDHEQTHLIARAASFVYAAPNASDTVPVPQGAQVPYLYYTSPLGGTDPYTGDPISFDTIIDVSDVHERKLQLLACHASQRDWLRSHHGIDEYLESTRRYDASLGQKLGVAFVEGFSQHKGHAYPNDNILNSVLGSPDVKKLAQS